MKSIIKYADSPASSFSPPNQRSVSFAIIQPHYLPQEFKTAGFEKIIKTMPEHGLRIKFSDQTNIVSDTNFISRDLGEKYLCAIHRKKLRSIEQNFIIQRQ
jgi:hypothetical protein